ncbi:MAG: SpoIIE family protein phosphatase [Erysipelotrichaceae bacterium]|nr:SpoIIE family protein phosphatase [Erysipelotrichaceae bacterium]MBQ1775358.1 SpoIIE family protein phosphatase [Erysipelotrichaceae bacterium]MBQ2078179.1 SpoIIE family protein phosphatase [Erysipelotrichaceae bacterium]MBQ2232584.1 SpoIIE family protein phosphatase [Erysipelotrichaceae bacterium]
MDNLVFSMVKIAIAPMFAAVVLEAILRSARFKDIGKKNKQIIAGVVFGILAIMATEFGVPFEGAIVNVRDASPIIAGIVFGGPAGFIAGLIGGIERWLCVYWGGGYYTRTACTIATILAGLAGYIAKRYLSDDHQITIPQATSVAFVIEVMHMLMIFVTNLTDAKRAFLYVETLTAPMVMVNTITVGVAIMLHRIFFPERDLGKKYELPTISDQLQKKLTGVVLIGFMITLTFNYLLQNNISSEDTRLILYLNTQDAAGDVVTKARRYVYLQTLNIANVTNKNIKRSALMNTMVRNSLSEINMVGPDGIIFMSTNEEYIGFDMRSTKMASEFMSLLDPHSSSRYVQDLREDCEAGTPCKFSGIRTDYGFLEIGMTVDQYHELIREGVASVSDNRHVGESGMILVLDQYGGIISSINSFSNEVRGLLRNVDFDKLDEMTVYQYDSPSIDVYYMFTNVEGYRILAAYPESEADFSRRISNYLTTFMETVVFAMMFSVIFGAIKTSVLKQVIDVKESLGHIVEGNLDTVVNVRENREFDELSDDINQTVDKLKTLIKEADERISKELRYAQQIQMAALPNIFPPYPDRDEFDIFASMDPAKEVGGDFYDLYLLNDSTLVFLVADVSGKGIPASLFMMRAKTIIKKLAEGGVSVGDIFTNANYELCNGNASMMFVTSWMGFLNLKTGVLEYANAGHNPALIKRKGGEYEFLKGPAGFVLGGMEGIAYKKQSVVLEPGDEIFLYTDGVVEATNLDKELYGEERLKKCINSCAGMDARGICETISADVEEFYKGAEQFDDITELSLRFLKKEDD